MADFDPKLKRETWLFQQTNLKDGYGRPCMKRLGFNLVEYDGIPELHVEPVNCEQLVTSSEDPEIVDPYIDGTGVVARIEVVEGEPFSELMEFN